MTNPAPEVDFVLSVMGNDLVGYGNGGFGDYGYGHDDIADIPLERIDRDNADNIDNPSGWVHTHSESPQAMNYVGAATGPWTDRPISSDYDVESTRIVSLKLEGMHVSEFGAIDPNAGTADAVSVSHPTTDWSTLKDNVRVALYQDDNRKTPGVQDRPNVGFKDLFIDQWDDQSRNYADGYVLFAEIRFVGFEELPN